MLNDVIHSRLSHSTLFSEVPEKLVYENRQRFSLTVYGAGETVLQEGKANHCIYIVHSGSVSVHKSLDGTGGEDRAHRVAILHPAEEFGEMSVLGDGIVSATVRAVEETVLVALDLSGIADDADAQALRRYLAGSVGPKVAARLRSSNQLSAEAMERELEANRLRTAAGYFIVIIMSMFAIYTLAQRAVQELQVFSWMEVYGSPLVIIVFMSGVLYMMAVSPFSFRYFGVTLGRWKPAVIDAVRYSLLFCIVLTLVKWLVISAQAGGQDRSVFQIAAMFTRLNPDGTVNWGTYMAFMAGYALLCPVQELIGRCGVQAPLFAFLQGSKRKRHLYSVLVSNLLSAAAHSHLNLAFAAATFLPGVFWGWLFTRHKSIVGVSVSHIIIGCYALFALGVEEFLK